MSTKDRDPIQEGRFQRMKVVPWVDHREQQVQRQRSQWACSVEAKQSRHAEAQSEGKEQPELRQKGQADVCCDLCMMC